MIRQPVYAYWSEHASIGAVTTGWGGDDIYRCRQCPEWQGEGIEAGERHSALHAVPITEISELLAATIRGECIEDEERYFCGMCDVDVTASQAFHEKGCEYALVRHWIRQISENRREVNKARRAARRGRSVARSEA